MDRTLIGELVANEHRYHAALNRLVQTYLDPIMRTVNRRHWESAQSTITVTRTLAAIQTALNAKIDNAGADKSTVIRIISDTRTELLVYLQYADVLPRALSSLSSALENSKKMKALLSAAVSTQSTTRSTVTAIQTVHSDDPLLADLFSLFNAALQHVAQYSQYFKELIAVADDGDRNVATDVHDWAMHTAADIRETFLLSQQRESTRQSTEMKQTFARNIAGNISTPTQRAQTQRDAVAHMQSADDFHSQQRHFSSPASVATPSSQHNSTSDNILSPKSLEMSSPSAVSPTTFNGSSSPTLSSPALSPSTASASSPTSPEHMLFRYVPRIILQRFLDIDHHHKRSSTANYTADNIPQSLSLYLSTQPTIQHFPTATLLIADVSGFTKLNEAFSTKEKGLGTEQVSTHLNRYFDQLLNIIERHGGDTVKFAGDALIILFVHPKHFKIYSTYRRVSLNSAHPHGHTAGSLPSSQTFTGNNNPNNNNISTGLLLSSKTFSISESNNIHGVLNADLSAFNLDDDDSEVVSDEDDGYHHNGNGESNTITSNNTNTNNNNHHNNNNPNIKTKNHKSFHRLFGKSHEEKQRKREQAETALRAVQCALQLQSDVGVYRAADGVELALHIAVGGGSSGVYAMHVGGYRNEYELLLTGAPFSQLDGALHAAGPKEVVVSKAVWDLIHKQCTGTVVRQPRGNGEVCVTKVNTPFIPKHIPYLSYNSLCTHPYISQAVKAYIPRCVLDVINAGHTSMLSEIRTATAIFCNLKGLVLNKSDSSDPTLTHRICYEMQRIITRNGGYRRQYLVDDKGSTLIVVFGVPPFAHEDDAYRGVRTAVEIKDQLNSMNITHGIGIASGTVYVGSVGSSSRQEHAVIGDIVNAAARLSGQKDRGDSFILCDQPTYDKVPRTVVMKSEGTVTVKGKSYPLRVYSPVGFDVMKPLLVTDDAAVGETMQRQAETQQFMVAFSDLIMSAKSKIIFIEGEPGIGKCWGTGTQLLMWSGAVKAVEDIIEGDQLMGDDGTPRTVQYGSVISGRGKMFRIRSNKRGHDDWTCNEDHILVLKTSACPRPQLKRGHWRVCCWTTKCGRDADSHVLKRQILPKLFFGTRDEAAEFSSSISSSPVVFECTVRDFLTMPPSVRTKCTMFQPEYVDFPQYGQSLQQRMERIWGRSITRHEVMETAWALGVWMSANIRPHFRSQRECERIKMSVNKRLVRWHIKVCGTSTYSAALKSSNHSHACAQTLFEIIRDQNSKFVQLLKEYDFYGFNKQFPLSLLTDTRPVRQALLDGLIDGKGNQLATCNWSEPSVKHRYVNGLLHLCRGLGFVVSDITTLTKRNITCQTCINFTITDIGEGEYHGFTLSGNGRCLLSNFQITHNTQLIRNFYRLTNLQATKINLLYAKGDATESTSVMAMWTGVLEQLMGLTAPTKTGSTKTKRTKQVHKFLKQILPHDACPDPRLPFLNLILAESVLIADNELSISLRNQPKLIMVQAANILYYVIANAVCYYQTKGKPTVMFVEDVHLLDASSADILLRVAEGIKPLLLVMSARPPRELENDRNRISDDAQLNTKPILMSPLMSPVNTVTTNEPAASATTPAVSLPIIAASAETGELMRHPSAASAARPSVTVPLEDTSIVDIVTPFSRSNQLVSPASTSEYYASGASKFMSPTSASFSSWSIEAASSNSSLSSSSWRKAAGLSTSETLSKSDRSINIAMARGSVSVSDMPSRNAHLNSLWSAYYHRILQLDSLQHVILTGLNVNTLSRLVCQRLHAHVMEQQLASLIMKRSRGNPLYAVEVASHLLAKGYVEVSSDGQLKLKSTIMREGRVMTADEASLDLPTSLKGLVTRRLDSLNVNELLVCKLASAVGSHEFDSGMLRPLCYDHSMSDDQIDRALLSLHRANIIAPVKNKITGMTPEFNLQAINKNNNHNQSAATNGNNNNTSDNNNNSHPDLVFYFCNELVQSACYDMLLFRQRLKLHYRLAQLELNKQKLAIQQDLNRGTVGIATETNTNATTSTTNNAISTTAMTDSNSSDDLIATKGTTSSGSNELNLRRESTLEYHYMKALESFAVDDGVSDTDEMNPSDLREFIRTAKHHMAKKMLVIPGEKSTVSPPSGAVLSSTYSNVSSATVDPMALEVANMQTPAPLITTKKRSSWRTLRRAAGNMPTPPSMSSDFSGTMSFSNSMLVSPSQLSPPDSTQASLQSSPELSRDSSQANESAQSATSLSLTSLLPTLTMSRSLTPPATATPPIVPPRGKTKGILIPKTLDAAEAAPISRSESASSSSLAEAADGESKEISPISQQNTSAAPLDGPTQSPIRAVSTGAEPLSSQPVLSPPLRPLRPRPTSSDVHVRHTSIDSLSTSSLPTPSHSPQLTSHSPQNRAQTPSNLKVQTETTPSPRQTLDDRQQQQHSIHALPGMQLDSDDDDIDDGNGQGEKVPRERKRPTPPITLRSLSDPLHTVVSPPPVPPETILRVSVAEMQDFARQIQLSDDQTSSLIQLFCAAGRRRNPPPLPTQHSQSVVTASLSPPRTPPTPPPRRVSLRSATAAAPRSITPEPMHSTIPVPATSTASTSTSTDSSVATHSRSTSQPVSGTATFIDVVQLATHKLQTTTQTQLHNAALDQAEVATVFPSQPPPPPRQYQTEGRAAHTV